MNDFETYCLKERYKQLNLNMPFLKVFGVRLSKFFPNVLLGFDVVAFDKWIAPKDNQNTWGAIFEKYGQPGVDLVKKLIE